MFVELVLSEVNVKLYCLFGVTGKWSGSKPVLIRVFSVSFIKIYSSKSPPIRYEGSNRRMDGHGLSIKYDMHKERLKV